MLLIKAQVNQLYWMDLSNIQTHVIMPINFRAVLGKVHSFHLILHFTLMKVSLQLHFGDIFIEQNNLALLQMSYFCCWSIFIL